MQLLKRLALHYAKALANKSLLCKCFANNIAVCKSLFLIRKIVFRSTTKSATALDSLCVTKKPAMSGLFYWWLTGLELVADTEGKNAGLVFEGSSSYLFVVVLVQDILALEVHILIRQIARANSVANTGNVG